jgi:PilZ domain
MTAERRETPRAHVLRRARIVYRRGFSTIDCVVLDVSPGGARLKVDEWLMLPRRFELRIENGPVHEAEVRYRDMQMTGIRFVEPVAA